nr:hypothetical protein Itr_chr07CG01810 [Ipomoea trifida]
MAMGEKDYYFLSIDCNLDNLHYVNWILTVDNTSDQCPMICLYHVTFVRYLYSKWLNIFIQTCLLEA